MLVLSRKMDEKITIGDDITITVVAVRGNQVRIGIDAPQHVSIQRQEVRERCKESRGSTHEPAQD